MANKSSNVRKRKDGRWEGRFKIGVYDDGRTKYKSVYARTYAEVKVKLSELSSVEKNNAFSIGKPVLFTDVLDMWLASVRVRLKGSTVLKYQNIITAHIKPELGGIKVSAITSLMINSFLEQKSNSGRIDKCGGLSSSYVKTIMLIINSAMKFAVKEKLCVPLNSEIYKPTAVKKEVPVLSFEAQQILEHFLIQNNNATNIGMLLSLNTGLRIGEVCALTWEDIDFNKKLLHVRHTVSKIIDKTTNKSVFIIDTPKTNASNRDIPLSDPLFVILKKYHDCSKSNYVVSDNQNFVSPRTYEYRYHRILKECDIRPINYHALRHTFATRCIEVGVDVKSLSEILGHANVSVTLNTYVHSSVELKRKQLEKLTNISA